MNSVFLALMTLRSLSTIYLLQGNVKASESLNLLADSLEAGRNIDARMREVADALKAGAAPDWDDLERRIREDADRLHGGGG